MIKNFLLFMLMASASVGYAQHLPDRTVVIDLAEDTTRVLTVNDIVDIQEMVNSRNSTDAHFQDVWSRQSFFDLSYNYNTQLKPKDNALLSGKDNEQKVGKFTSDWGASLTLGRNYRLHKKPIADMVLFNLDWTYINLNANHFKAEGNAALYDSSLKNEVPNGDGGTDVFKYIPWNLEKYEANFSMALGPSVTVAPFIYLNVPQLHFLKFNVYYHVGYEVSMLFINNDKKYDLNPNIQGGKDNQGLDGLKMNLGHGLTTTFGVSMSWKSIGIGWETRNANLNYRALDRETYGREHYKFKFTSGRIYLQIRY